MKSMFVLVFKTEWEGIEIVSVQGPDNFPGLSIRHYNLSTTVGVYDMWDKVKVSNISVIHSHTHPMLRFNI
jgi:hypothetical protein